MILATGVRSRHNRCGGHGAILVHTVGRGGLLASVGADQMDALEGFPKFVISVIVEGVQVGANLNSWWVKKGYRLRLVLDI